MKRSPDIDYAEPFVLGLMKTGGSSVSCCDRALREINDNSCIKNKMLGNGIPTELFCQSRPEILDELQQNFAQLVVVLKREQNERGCKSFKLALSELFPASHFHLCYLV